ncbi:MAG: hypothetical protein V1709_05270 [Planctomycetota bacterium]
MDADKNRMFNSKLPETPTEIGPTIVGGRPPGSTKNSLPIPRGIEVLVKKASVDPEFRALLLAKRDESAKEIGLELSPMEKNIIRSAPESQLISIVNSIKVSPHLKPILLGKVAGVMLAALTAASLSGCFIEDSGSSDLRSGGIRPDIPPISITYNTAISITQNSATLNDIVNPNGVSTTVYFQWGINTAYGTLTAEQDIGSGTSAINVSADLTGLTPNTTYQYRIVVRRGGYTYYGTNQSFVTSN